MPLTFSDATGRRCVYAGSRSVSMGRARLQRVRASESTEEWGGGGRPAFSGDLAQLSLGMAAHARRRSEVQC